MSQSIRHDQNARGAKALAATRAEFIPATLTTLILGVLIGLLSGAVWMQLT